MNVPPAITGLLDEGERLIWHGKPRLDILFGYSDWFALVLWSIIGIFAAFAILLGHSAFALVAGVAAMLIMTGVVILCVLGLLRRQQTLYVVTDQRIAIVSTSSLDRTVRSKHYDANFTVTAYSSPGETTILYFGDVWRLFHWRYPPNHRFLDVMDPPVFVFLDDGPSVIEKVTAAKKEMLAR